jgi:hypothetical protein
VLSKNIVGYVLRRIARLPCSSLDEMASRVWEHAPGGTERVEPLVAIPGSLERVVSAPTDWGAPVSREEVVSNALCREQKVPPTALYEIRDALVSRGSVYARGHRYHLLYPDGSSRTRPAFRSAAETIDEAVLTCSPWGSNFFGHWVAEDCALQLLAESLGHEVIDIARPIWKHEPGYRELLELRAPRQVEHALVRKLTVIVDGGPRSTSVGG